MKKNDTVCNGPVFKKLKILECNSVLDILLNPSEICLANVIISVDKVKVQALKKSNKGSTALMPLEKLLHLGCKENDKGEGEGEGGIVKTLLDTLLPKA